ncbi:MAG: DUF1273 family protein [Clostridia bacterium]|nr:DUF1273 family protein [Clostridia bacterium]
MENYETLKTCAFTGHRILDSEFNVDKLEEVINNVLKKGYKTFLVGMAMGFDLKCFEILLTKRSYNIDIIACVPCKEQSKNYNKIEKERYEEFIKKADKIVYISNEYTNGCMQLRNRYMVDNSSLLIAYLKYFKGGSLYTVNYAKKKQKEIIFI